MNACVLGLLTLSSWASMIMPYLFQFSSFVGIYHCIVCYLCENCPLLLVDMHDVLLSSIWWQRINLSLFTMELFWHPIVVILKLELMKFTDENVHFRYLTMMNAPFHFAYFRMPYYQLESLIKHETKIEGNSMIS